MNHKKETILLCILCILLPLACVWPGSNRSGDAFSVTPEVEPPVLLTRKAAIFYVPHADDEVLSMGAAILEAKRNYSPVVLVLLSKGTGSGAFAKVNDRMQAAGLSPLTLEGFGESRVREFRDSAQCLGIEGQDVYVYDLPDGKIIPEMVRKIILTFEAKHPQAFHQSMSYLDPHPDHAVSGTALRELRKEHAVSSDRYFISPQVWESFPAAQNIKITSDSSFKQYKEALEAYRKWNPKEGRYGIGILSVGHIFELAETQLESHWHD
jgi:LmbE family N-acetylglucosaminyl deacetylase